MILLQAGGGFPIEMMLLIMGIFLVVNFVIIGPKQKRKEKEAQAYISALSSGAKVVTFSGIHGKFVKEDGDVYIVEIDTNTKVRMDKTAINFEATKKLNS